MKKSIILLFIFVFSFLIKAEVVINKDLEGIFTGKVVETLTTGPEYENGKKSIYVYTAIYESVASHWRYGSYLCDHGFVNSQTNYSGTVSPSSCGFSDPVNNVYPREHKFNFHILNLYETKYYFTAGSIHNGSIKVEKFTCPNIPSSLTENFIIGTSGNWGEAVYTPDNREQILNTGNGCIYPEICYVCDAKDICGTHHECPCPFSKICKRRDCPCASEGKVPTYYDEVFRNTEHRTLTTAEKNSLGIKCNGKKICDFHEVKCENGCFKNGECPTCADVANIIYGDYRGGSVSTGKETIPIVKCTIHVYKHPIICSSCKLKACAQHGHICKERCPSMNDCQAMSCSSCGLQYCSTHTQSVYDNHFVSCANCKTKKECPGAHECLECPDTPNCNEVICTSCSNKYCGYHDKQCQCQKPCYEKPDCQSAMCVKSECKNYLTGFCKTHAPHNCECKHCMTECLRCKSTYCVWCAIPHECKSGAGSGSGGAGGGSGGGGILPPGGGDTDNPGGGDGTSGGGDDNENGDGSSGGGDSGGSVGGGTGGNDGDNEGGSGGSGSGGTGDGGGSGGNDKEDTILVCPNMPTCATAQCENCLTKFCHHAINQHFCKSTDLSCPKMANCNVITCIDCKSSYCKTHIPHRHVGEEIACPLRDDCANVTCKVCFLNYCKTHKTHGCKVLCPNTDSCGWIICKDCSFIYCFEHEFHVCRTDLLPCPSQDDCNLVTCYDCEAKYCFTHTDIKLHTHNCFTKKDCKPTDCQKCGIVYCNKHAKHNCINCPYTLQCINHICATCGVSYCSSHITHECAKHVCSNVACSICKVEYCQTCTQHTCVLCPNKGDCILLKCDKCTIKSCITHDKKHDCSVTDGDNTGDDNNSGDKDNPGEDNDDNKPDDDKGGNNNNNNSNGSTGGSIDMTPDNNVDSLNGNKENGFGYSILAGGIAVGVGSADQSKAQPTTPRQVNDMAEDVGTSRRVDDGKTSEYKYKKKWWQ